MKTAAIIALAGTAALATAGVTNTYGPGAGNSFIDNFTVSSSIVVADSGTIADLDVQVLGMVHSWVGDLQITLRRAASR
jgi:subtilisin-like proprotein convertase family protein